MKKPILVTVITLLLVLGLVATAHLVNVVELIKRLHGG
jgi:hypothetical protein